MEFDLGLAKEQSEKNPVYYIQYAHARICSILRRCRIKNSKLKIEPQNLKLLTHSRELELIKKLIIFPDIVEEITKSYQVHRLTHYATQLAGAFHQFYQECRVLTQEEEVTKARLALVMATQIVLRNLLKLLGISLPTKM